MVEIRGTPGNSKDLGAIPVHFGAIPRFSGKKCDWGVYGMISNRWGFKRLCPKLPIGDDNPAESFEAEALPNPRWAADHGHPRVRVMDVHLHPKACFPRCFEAGRPPA